MLHYDLDFEWNNYIFTGVSILIWKYKLSRILTLNFRRLQFEIDFGRFANWKWVLYNFFNSIKWALFVSTFDFDWTTWYIIIANILYHNCFCEQLGLVQDLVTTIFTRNDFDVYRLLRLWHIIQLFFWLNHNLLTKLLT